MKKILTIVSILASYQLNAGGMTGGSGSPQNFTGGGTGVIGSPILLEEPEFRRILRQALTTGTILIGDEYKVKEISAVDRTVTASNEEETASAAWRLARCL